MEQSRKKIGLALGGGAAKAAAHIGVIEALEFLGIPIDIVGGTSAGAFVGGWYAATKDIKALKDILEKTDWRARISWRDISPRRVSAVFNTKKLEAFVTEVIGPKRIEDLQIPFVVVATDLKNGEPVEFREGDLTRAIMASSAVPGIFPPVEWDGKILVDGGLTEPVPFRAVRAMGADVVIGVDLTNDYIVESGKKMEKEFWRPWQILNIVYNSFSVIQHELAKEQLTPADILLTPRVGHINPAEFSRIREGWTAGMEEVYAMKKVIFEKTGVQEPSKALGEKVREFLFQ